MRVLVVGGGISGLAYAHALKRMSPSVSVTLCEARECGGWIRTRTDLFGEEHADAAMEMGPRALRPQGEPFLAMLGHLGLVGETVLMPVAQTPRFYVPKQEAFGFFDMMQMGTRVLLKLARARLMDQQSEALIVSEDETVADWCARVFGSDRTGQQVSSLVSTMLTGIFAGHAETLSMRACLPQIMAFVDPLNAPDLSAFDAAPAGFDQFKVTPGSAAHVLQKRIKENHARQITFKGGVERLVKSLRHSAQVQGVEVYEHRPIESLQLGGDIRSDLGSFDHVCLATPAKVSANIVGSQQWSQLSEFASSLHVADMTLAHVLSPKGDLLPLKFAKTLGVLANTPHSDLSLGVFLDSHCFPQLSNGKLRMTWLLGGAKYPHMHLSSEEVTKQVLSDMRTWLSAPVRRNFEAIGDDTFRTVSLENDEVLLHVSRQKECIPQYDTSHRANVDRLKQSTPHNVTLLGASYDSVAVPQLVCRAVHAAADLVRQSSFAE